ncbi:MAG: lytic transglycosylase domain-containing protein [Clostridiaceae bacterium]|nr:lytic transglycosylase domain-containing protein [Clostridiaceae bacterium]
MSNSRKKITIIIILVLVILAAFVLTMYNIVRRIYPLEYMDFIGKYSDQYDLDPYMVMAVIRVESRFRPEAVSHKDARGLMQITKGTGEWAARKLQLDDYNEDKLFDPETNIRIGCWYLNTLLLEFGNTDLMLAAYNGGSGNVAKWLMDTNYSKDGRNLDKIPFKETDKYITKVKDSYTIYKKLYGNPF